MLTLDTILTRLLVVALHLALATGPACGAYLSTLAPYRRSNDDDEHLAWYGHACASRLWATGFTISNLAVGVNYATGFLWRQLVDLDAVFGALWPVGHGGRFVWLPKYSILR